MEYLHIIILATIQGLTEFLPISSSAHLVLVPRLFGFSDPGLDVDAFLHLGTLAATLIYFRKEVLAMLQSFISKRPADRKLALGIIIATIPVLGIGFGFKGFFEADIVRSLLSMIVTLLLGSVLMYYADNFIKKQKQHKTIEDLSIKEMLFVGLMQTLALFPGVSRSGSTISAGLFVGLGRDSAARFSFLVGLPAVAGAGLLALKDLVETGINSDSSIIPLFLGFITSFIVGYLAIDFMIKFLKNHDLMGFIVYRIVLASILLSYLIYSTADFVFAKF